MNEFRRACVRAAGVVGLVLGLWPGEGRAFEPRTQANLLLNGGFDLGAPGPDGWYVEVDSATPAGMAALTPSTTSFISAGRAVQTMMYASGQADWRQQVAGIDDKLRYRLRAHVFATDVSAESHGIEVHWFGATGYIARHVVASTRQAAWSEVVSENIAPPQGATSAYVLLRSYKKGLYRFDDVVFGPRDEGIASEGDFPLVLYDLPSRELLVNGTFSQVSPSATQANELMPGAWVRRVDEGESTQEWAFSCGLPPASAEKKQGTLVTHQENTGQSDWRQFVPDIDVSLGYCLGGTIKADNVAQGSHGITVVWVDGEGHELGDEAVSSYVAGSPENVSICGLHPPAGTAGAWVLLRSYLPGEYCFDNVSLSIDRNAAAWYGEVKEAGFSQVFAEASAFNAVQAAGLQATFAINTSLQPGENPSGLISQVNDVRSHVATLHTVDEPAWALDYQPSPVPAPLLVDGYEALGACVDPLPPIWLNHAPRGTGPEPDNFKLLREYNPAADIFSFDIYPVPSGWGHSILQTQGPAAVGAHTDLLYELLSEGGAQRKPIWMVLQGLAWTDLQDPARVLEHGVEVQWFSESGGFLGRDVLSSPTPNRWHMLAHQTLTPPAGASYAWVLLRAYHAGDYAFDRVRFGKVGEPDALNESGDFEGYVEGSGQTAPPGWLFDAASPIDSVARWGGGPALSGTAALHIQMRKHGQADWRRLVQNIDPNAQYTLSGAVYARTRPTLAESRFMAYDAIIHGARGLAYWGTRFVPATAELWGDLRAVAHELRGLSHALVLPTSFRTVSVTASGQPAADIETLLLGTGPGPLYLLAANRGASPLPALSVSVSGLPLSHVVRVDGNPIAIANNAFADTIEPYGVRVYELE